MKYFIYKLFAELKSETSFEKIVSMYVLTSRDIYFNNYIVWCVILPMFYKCEQ
jgi:hypothetical protein